MGSGPISPGSFHWLTLGCKRQGTPAPHWWQACFPSSPPCRAVDRVTDHAFMPCSVNAFERPWVTIALSHKMSRPEDAVQYVASIRTAKTRFAL